jgi:hypothetical protein
MNEQPLSMVTAPKPSGEITLADVVERLKDEFESRLPLALIVATIRRCRRELEITIGVPVHLDRVEDLARRRLVKYADIYDRGPLRRHDRRRLR